MKKKLEYDEIMDRLKSLSDPKAVEGMARFGITANNVYGVSIPNLRQIAKQTGKDHILAQKLWDSGIHEARILASMVDDPDQVTDKQMEKWVIDFDSWDVCDGVCLNLFDKTQFAYQKAIQWSEREEEFVKRAGFAMMAVLAFHEKSAKDDLFEQFFPMIKRESIDNRNYVKKAVNWALRQIGKRNPNLNEKAIELAMEIQQIESKSAKWIASDAIRELTNEKIQARLEG
jgi:3-methyladenine DNA glycosylase AlkD